MILFTLGMPLQQFLCGCRRLVARGFSVGVNTFAIVGHVVVLLPSRTSHAAVPGHVPFGLDVGVLNGWLVGHVFALPTSGPSG